MKKLQKNFYQGNTKKGHLQSDEVHRENRCVWYCY